MSAEYSIDTGPPPSTGLRRLKEVVVGSASSVLLPVLQRAARSHVGGETLDDALAVAHRLVHEGTPSTLGFWDTPAYGPRQVAGVYLDTIDAIAKSRLDSYVSLKPPALRFDAGVAAELGAAARAAGVRVHCDSHGPDVAAPSHAMERTLVEHCGAEAVSTTLPGRWRRSLADADWAIEQGIGVRVVKGQWPDPADPARELRHGFLEVVDRLAGRARHVRVATHDVALATEAVARLRRASTPCELELLFGMPMKSALRWASEAAVPVRIYVPFGKGFIPSAIGTLKHNPRLALRIVMNLAAGR